uniref:Choline transporter-like protein n=1 Tax=Strombidinopsis acuminata TaxID=141414 RepID=A0A7S3RN90_9SPIT|mmetsp:Transcript_114837/g.159394  ORF Transcript_114837/g.159394 Transcript_114837/m.159394 type:complete len:362 (+) Transcript_114837:835-1920(+)
MYCLCIACNFRSLQISLAVIETAADYFAQTKRILIMPVIFFFMALIWFGLWLGGFMTICSIGDIYVTGGSQYKNVEWSSGTTTMVWFMIFGLIWTISFIISMNDYVIVVSAATWYFSKKSDGGWEGHSDIWRGFQWGFRYNLGSIAFGSLVIAFSAIIREIMEYIGEKLREATGENCCVRCMVNCCLCCVNCTDRFIRYLTENAYIYMALSGDGFCESALNSFLLMLKNSAKFSFVSSVSSTFMFLAKLSISFLTAYTCYGFMQLSSQMQEFEVNSPTMPLLLVFLFSYTVAAIFMSIFQVGANTILQCFLVDRDIADQKNELDSMMSHVPAALKKFLDGYEQWEAVHDKVDDQEKANELN